MQLDLVSPERKLASMEVSAVTIPGMQGEITALPGHAPFLTTLRPGFVTAATAGGSREYFVSGGFAEISATAVAILAEEAVERSEAGRELVNRLLAEARAALDGASADTRTAAALRVNDLAELLGRIGG
jgi:F-type H+-transporting ATPase subunit epsilon